MAATVSYRCEFEACYVQNSELHAHRYKIEVTVGSVTNYAATGQIIDYRVLAGFVKSICPDQQFLLGKDATPEETAVGMCLKACGVSVMHRSHTLSIESFCESLAAELQDILDRHEYGVQVIELKLRETNDSYATWSI